MFALAEPVESVTVRNIPVNRVKSVRELGTGVELPFSYRTELDQRHRPDPLGELSFNVRTLTSGAVVPVFVLEIARTA